MFEIICRHLNTSSCVHMCFDFTQYFCPSVWELSESHAESNDWCITIGNLLTTATTGTGSTA